MHETAILLLCCAALAACSKEATATGPAAASREGPEASASEGFSGRATLVGELGRVDQGALIVSVYPTGNKMPLMTYRVDLQSPQVTRGEGELYFDFRLDPTTSMIPGSVPEGMSVEVEVRYDADGYVETKEGDVAVRVPAQPGDEDLALTLPAGP